MPYTADATYKADNPANAFVRFAILPGVHDATNGAVRNLYTGGLLTQTLRDGATVGSDADGAFVDMRVSAQFPQKLATVGYSWQLDPYNCWMVLVCKPDAAAVNAYHFAAVFELDPPNQPLMTLQPAPPGNDPANNLRVLSGNGASEFNGIRASIPTNGALTAIGVRIFWDGVNRRVFLFRPGLPIVEASTGPGSPYIGRAGFLEWASACGRLYYAIGGNAYDEVNRIGMADSVVQAVVDNAQAVTLNAAAAPAQPTQTTIDGYAQDMAAPSTIDGYAQDTEAPLGTVGADFDVRWSVEGVSTGTTVVGRSMDVRWTMESLVAQPVDSALPFQWLIAQDNTSEFGFDYDTTLPTIQTVKPLIPYSADGPQVLVETRYRSDLTAAFSAWSPNNPDAPIVVRQFQARIRIAPGPSRIIRSFAVYLINAA